jgi:hypothetical protein
MLLEIPAGNRILWIDACRKQGVEGKAASGDASPKAYTKQKFNEEQEPVRVGNTESEVVVATSDMAQRSFDGLDVIPGYVNDILKQAGKNRNFSLERIGADESGDFPYAIAAIHDQQRTLLYNPEMKYTLSEWEAKFLLSHGIFQLV